MIVDDLQNGQIVIQRQTNDGYFDFWDWNYVLQTIGELDRDRTVSLVMPMTVSFLTKQTHPLSRLDWINVEIMNWNDLKVPVVLSLGREIPKLVTV